MFHELINEEPQFVNLMGDLLDAVDDFVKANDKQKESNNTGLPSVDMILAASQIFKVHADLTPHIEEIRRRERAEDLSSDYE